MDRNSWLNNAGKLETQRTGLVMEVVKRQMRLEQSGGSTPELLRPFTQPYVGKPFEVLAPLFCYCFMASFFAC